MKASVTLTLDEPVLAAAKTFAATERRSLSQQTEIWIEEKLRQLGILPRKPAKPAKPARRS